MALVDGTAVIRGADTAANDATFAQSAIETQRALIGKVGAADGSGAVLGGHVYNADVYAFRNNAAGTQCLMWKATSTGWVQQALGNRVSFTSGTDEMVDSGTLTQSGITAPIRRVVKQSGDWSSNDAAGYIIVGDVSGAPFAAGAATDGASGACTLSGAETAQTIQPSGRFEFRNYNFFGSTKTKRMYGVSGVDYAFEFDGTSFVPIITGNTVDTPTHIEIYKEHLFLAFANGSLQNGSTGTPYVWSGGGANEYGFGEDIVGIIREIGKSLLILGRNKTEVLHGSNTSDDPWDVADISAESGGIEWTLQRLYKSRYLDDNGITNAESVQAFGDFKVNTTSQLINPLIDVKKESVISSILVRKKNQYRLFFDDGTSIVATYNGRKLAGWSTMAYRDSVGSGIPVRVTANGEDSSGTEILFFGSDDGYLYQMDKGTSFDGAPVSAAVILAYFNAGSPAYSKHWHKVDLEMEGANGAVISYNAVFDYATGSSPPDLTGTVTLASGGGYWNTALWNQFTWASDDVTLVDGDITGDGRNVSLQISSVATYIEPHTILGATFHYSMRRLVR